MSKTVKGFNMVLGGIRIMVAGFFATALILVLFPTISALAAVLTYGLAMLIKSDFWVLLVILIAIMSVSNLIAKFIIPDLPTSG